MKRILSLVTIVTMLAAGTAFAADPVLGTWKLDVEKSKFSSTKLKSGTRVYTESNGLYTLEQKSTSADGKEITSKTTYRENKEEKQAPGGVSDLTLAKKVDANTWDFELKKDGKVVGRVHRTISPDGKTLTVHNKGVKLSGGEGDETLVYHKE